MELAIGGLFFAAAALAVAAMGFAIQRGATCTVAAVDEVLTQRRASRLVALVEASLRVAIGLAIARQLHWLAQPPAGFELSAWTVVGAALLGLALGSTQPMIGGGTSTASRKRGRCLA